MCFFFPSLLNVYIKYPKVKSWDRMTENNRILLTLSPLHPLHFLLPFFSQYTFKIKSGRASNNPTGGTRLLHFPASLCSLNRTGPVIALLSFGGIPLSFFQCHASRLNSNLNAAPSNVFEISLTGYKEPKNCVVNRISWLCRWKGNLFMIRLIFSTSFHFQFSGCL